MEYMLHLDHFSFALAFSSMGNKLIHTLLISSLLGTHLTSVLCGIVSLFIIHPFIRVTYRLGEFSPNRRHTVTTGESPSVVLKSDPEACITAKLLYAHTSAVYPQSHVRTRVQRGPRGGGRPLMSRFAGCPAVELRWQTASIASCIWDWSTRVAARSSLVSQSCASVNSVSSSPVAAIWKSPGISRTGSH